MFFEIDNLIEAIDSAVIEQAGGDMKEKFMSVGAYRLKMWQVDEGVSSRQFAESLGVTKDAFRKYRAGIIRPRDEIRLAISVHTNGVVEPGDWSVLHERR